jgi:hypothetical protein
MFRTERYLCMHTCMQEFVTLWVSARRVRSQASCAYTKFRGKPLQVGRNLVRKGTRWQGPCMHACTYQKMYACTYQKMYACMYIPKNICMHVHTKKCMHACTYQKGAKLHMKWKSKVKSEIEIRFVLAQVPICISPSTHVCMHDVRIHVCCFRSRNYQAYAWKNLICA